ncbi:MAG: nitrilase-related carbon-nitrogen hydrolase [Bacillota bacterium]
MHLVAVQMELDVKDYWNETLFRKKIDSIMQKIESERKGDDPTLVVFPEDTGLMLVAQGYKNSLQNVNNISIGIEKLSKNLFLKTLWTKIVYDLPWVPALFYNRHQQIARTYFKVFSEMAAKYEVYLVGGSVILPDYEIEDGKALIKKPLDSKVYNISYLFDPRGNIIGKQKKVNLIELEAEDALNLNKGKTEELEVFETELGKIGIAICLDAFEDRVIEKLVEKDADILVQPSANPGKWDQDQQQEWLFSSYKRVFIDRKFRYAVNPMMVGSLWNIDFYGQSGIIADRDQISEENTGYKDLGNMPGFVKTAGTEKEEEVIIVKVPLL